MLARPCFLSRKATGMQRASTVLMRMRLRSNKSSIKCPTDELGLPLSPTWSVHALIGSYPSPSISDATLTRLHELSALLPPPEDSHEFKKLKADMEDLVRLIEAVRMGPQTATEGGGVPDGRIWPQGRGIAISDAIVEQSEPAGSPPLKRELLKHAQRTKDGYYLVDSSKTKG